MKEGDIKLLRIVPKLSLEQEAAQEHYQRIKDAKEATDKHLTNWQEKDKLAKKLASEAAIERYEESKRNGNTTKHLDYKVAHKCLEYVLNNVVADESKCKGIICSIATQQGYTIEQIDKAYNLGCQDTKDYRKSLLDSFKTQLDSLTRHTPLTKTQLNHKQANTLPKLVKAIVRAIKYREDQKAMREREKQMENELQALRAKLIEVGDYSKQGSIKIAKVMKEQGFTYQQIADRFDITKRTAINWVKHTES